MDAKLEQVLIAQCAPTLAGMKEGCLFRYSDKSGTAEHIQRLNEKLSQKGVLVYVLQKDEKGFLIYVYRPTKLEKCLFQPEVRCFLCEKGYAACETAEDCLRKLRQMLRGTSGFPHEIGVFLGYPLCDVQGFIQNKGENYIISGPWKVYGAHAAAQQLFVRYQKCRRIYRERYARGYTVLQLTVAV